jgi:hypothetical protein
MEFMKSEAFTGFLCKNCGKTFPIPEQASTLDHAAFTEIITAVKVHRCPANSEPSPEPAETATPS